MSGPMEEAKNGCHGTAGRPSVAKLVVVAGNQKRIPSRNAMLGEELVIRVVSVQDED